MVAVHREDDLRHCGAQTIVTGQGTVRANGKLIAVVDDKCSHGDGDLVSTSPGTVIIEGKKLIVVTDTNTAGDNALHNTPETDPDTGSPDVNAY